MRGKINEKIKNQNTQNKVKIDQMATGFHIVLLLMLNLFYFGVLIPNAFSKDDSADQTINRYRTATMMWFILGI